MTKKTMKCPECGRTVPMDAVLCPDCGNYIDDTELYDLEDPEEEYSDSFEEEYQDLYEDEKKGLPVFHHTDGEMRRLDALIQTLKKACRELEKQHTEIKKVYRSREQLKETDKKLAMLLPLVGTLYETYLRKIRGVYWISQMANLIHRGLPTSHIRDWDADYCEKVLTWLDLEKPVKEEILEVFANW